MSPYLILATLENIRGYSLVLGVVGIVAGILLINAHKRSYLKVVRQIPDPRLEKFESRKFRRRATVAAMVTSAGCLMSSLYWVTEAKIFAIFILLIMSLLVGILGIAFIDLFSVSLQTMLRADDADQKKFVEEYLRRREQTKNDSEEI